MHDIRPPGLFPLLSDVSVAERVAERVADRALGLLSPEGVAVDRFLMSLHPESAQVERETLAYAETLDLEQAAERHLERFERLCGYPPGTLLDLS